MDDQRTNREGSGIRQLCKVLLCVVAALGYLNIVAITAHEKLLGGAVSKIENGRYFVWDKWNQEEFTEVSELSYRRLQFHESSVFFTTLIGFAAFAGLIRLSNDREK